MTQLYKQSGGNLMCVEAADRVREAELRAAGFTTLEELFPDTSAPESKPQRKGRKA